MPACSSKAGFVEARVPPIFAGLDQGKNTRGQDVQSTLPAAEVDPSTALQPSRERELQLPELERQGRLLGPARGET